MQERSDDHIRAKCFHPAGVFIEFSQDQIEQSIPQRFEKIVREFPDRTAVESTRYRFTYADLNRLANQTAHAVLSAGGDGNRSVAVLMEHDAPVVGAIMGVLKAGKFYVRFDPSLPAARTRFILDDVEAEFRITNTKHLPLANSLVKSSRQLLNIDEIKDWLDTDLPARAQPDDLSWVIYTSGSTGKPKGVMQTHRNVLHFMMNYTNGLHICAHDQLTLLFSFSVNGGAHDIFAALLKGAAVCPYDLKTEGFARLAQWLIDERITIIIRCLPFFGSLPRVWAKKTSRTFESCGSGVNLRTGEMSRWSKSTFQTIVFSSTVWEARRQEVSGCSF